VGWNLAGIQTLDAVYPALAASLASLIAVSLFTGPPPPEKWQPLFKEPN